MCVIPLNCTSETVTGACHLHFPTSRQLRALPSPSLPLEEFFMIRPLCSVPSDPQVIVPRSYMPCTTFRGAIHTDHNVNDTLELCSTQPAQPDEMALVVPKGSQATLRICSRPLIGWVGGWGVHLFYCFQVIQQWKPRQMKHPREYEYLYFQLHWTCILHPHECQFVLFWVPLKLAQAPGVLLA